MRKGMLVLLVLSLIFLVGCNNDRIDPSKLKIEDVSGIQWNIAEEDFVNQINNKKYTSETRKTDSGEENLITFESAECNSYKCNITYVFDSNILSSIDVNFFKENQENILPSLYDDTIKIFGKEIKKDTQKGTQYYAWETDDYNLSIFAIDKDNQSYEDWTTIIHLHISSN